MTKQKWKNKNVKPDRRLQNNFATLCLKYVSCGSWPVDQGYNNVFSYLHSKHTINWGYFDPKGQVFPKFEIVNVSMTLQAKQCFSSANIFASNYYDNENSRDFVIFFNLRQLFFKRCSRGNFVSKQCEFTVINNIFLLKPFF